MQRSYSPSSYDDDYCLKPPLLLWLAALYLSRGVLLPLLMGMGSMIGTNPDALNLFHQLWSVEALIPSSVAAVVCLALFRRGPSASSVVRWIWAHGRVFLASAAALDLLLSVLPLVRTRELGADTAPALFVGAADLYFLVYVLAARRVRDTFGDFPPRVAIRKR
jgi:hypothetical protein